MRIEARHLAAYVECIANDLLDDRAEERGDPRRDGPAIRDFGDADYDLQHDLEVLIEGVVADWLIMQRESPKPILGWVPYEAGYQDGLAARAIAKIRAT